MTMRFPPTRNDLDIKEKQRLLRQTRKLSQIFGEPPWDDAEQPHLDGYNRPAVESASKDHPQQRQQHIRFSKRSLIDSDSPSRPFCFPLDPRSAEANKMPQPLLRPLRDALGRNNSTTRRQPTHPSHISQLEPARFGLGRAGSTGSTGSDESARGASHLSIVGDKPTRSSSLRITNRQARVKDKSRRRSVQVHNQDIDSIQTHSRRSTELFTPTHSQRRSVTLWTRRRTAKDDPAADQSREDDSSADSNQPLTEAQRIQSIRRGRKLTQLFGTEPPISLYRAPPLFEDEEAEALSATTGESIEYVALPSSDMTSLPSIYPDERSVMRFSHATISPISTSFASSAFTTADPFQEPENEEQRPETPAVQTSDDDPDFVQSQDPHERSGDSATVTFRRRRLQAAKLSRFFGIAYNDLANRMAGSKNQAEGREMHSAEVGVKIQERGGFWGRSEGGYSTATAQEADMNDVIALLRQMPRA